MAITQYVENGVQAKTAIEQLEAQGYSRDHIHLFAHFKKRADDLADELDLGKVGISELGLGQTFKNFFNSSDDKIHSKLEALGLTDVDIEEAMRELDNGKLLLVAHHLE